MSGGPRWGGTADADWYPWLRDQLDGETHIVDLDAPDAPTIEGCAGRLRAEVAACRPAVLVGHNVGCQVVMRYLATDRRAVDGIVLVAPWLTVDEPWDTLRPWLDTPIDLSAVRAAAGRIEVASSGTSTGLPSSL